MEKTLGILSGMGTNAGLKFVQKLNENQNCNCDQEFIPFLMYNNSSIPDRTESILAKGSSPMREIRNSIKLLTNSGVSFIISTCVTSIYFIDQLPIEERKILINPIDLLCQQLDKGEVKGRKIGVLATTGSIISGVFQSKLGQLDGIEILILDEQKQEELFMEAVYGEEGLKSTYYEWNSISKSKIQMCVEDLEKRGAELIIGGCSEMQLIMDEIITNVKYIDLMDLSIEFILEEFRKK